MIGQLYVESEDLAINLTPSLGSWINRKLIELL